MVKNTVKVYARLKRENSVKSIVEYGVEDCVECQKLNFYNVVGVDAQNCRNSCLKFRFHKIFDQTSSQTDVFDTIAKPVVNSTLNGYNGTIFAYGQTGSGKTYAITGASSEYNERGIIPRSIQHVFEFTNASPDFYTIHISYMEIYKETAYDFLNPKHHASRLEELPRVILLEDAKGETHLRNLSVLPVCTEQEAMRLLFLGDTNRTIAETPLNECSSRSHCIFTMYLTTKASKTGKIRRSKLNLVDLAGSERVHKSKITGSILTEAKHINLSLHYLEQVILALSQTKRPHIPYRNSIMTYMLRDSLAGNCLTVMLATLALSKGNIDETISTCKFAQRVSMMNTEAQINEEIDPQQEIMVLREEVQDLRRQLMLLKGITTQEKLSKDEEKQCKSLVKKFLRGDCSELNVGCDMRKIHLCFNFLKHSVTVQQQKQTVNKENQTSIYEELLRQKDEEIQSLRGILEDKTTPSSNLCNDYNLNPQELDTFRNFIETTGNTTELECISQQLNQKYEIAKTFAQTVVQCQKNILAIRKTLEGNNCSSLMMEELNARLISQQSTYREAILQLQNLRKETDHLKHGLQQVRIKLVQRFRETARMKREGDGQQIWQVLEARNQDEDVLRESCRFNDSTEQVITEDTTRGHPTNSKVEISTALENDKVEPNGYVNRIVVGEETVDSKDKSETVLDELQLPSYHNSEEPNEKLNKTVPPDDSTSKGFETTRNFAKFLKESDSRGFIDFMETVPLTGDEEVDDEIFSFYRTKFNCK